MTCYLNDPLLDRDVVRVERFGLAHSTAIRERMPRKRSGRRALVRVTHASVGVTDAMAMRGDYLLQPVRGFVSGYDFVGVIECLPAGDCFDLHVCGHPAPDGRTRKLHQRRAVAAGAGA